MALIKKEFRKYDLESKPTVITMKLNKEERTNLEWCKSILNQSKDGTAMKQLAWIGAKVLQQDSTRMVLETVFKNKRKNQRTGANVEFQ